MQSSYQFACLGSHAEMFMKFVVVYIEQNDDSLLKRGTLTYMAAQCL